MSIINSFDNKSKPLIDLNAFFEPKNIADICIITFSIKVKEMILGKYHCEIVGSTSTANGEINIYLLEFDGKRILFYMSPIGAAVAASTMHEVHYITGASKFVVYGSCGILDNEKCMGKLIVPTEAYRDEGLSYHYMEPSDYVKIRNSNKIASILDEHNYPYVCGKTWTTDGIYMETVNKANARREDGCLTVEMEAAGLQALCDFHGYELFIFFFGADLLIEDSWEKGSLGNEKEYEIQKKTFEVARTIALSI